ncbi:MAG: hypothetical protein V2I33_09470, partial [Kangiellaceae bacterium]|nr:hypothetical protein [Kangiellaceae bacterium]
MNEFDALSVAFQEFQKEFIELADWSLNFDHAKRRAGVCYLTKQQIAISKHHVVLNDEDVVFDTLMHELA